MVLPQQIQHGAMQHNKMLGGSLGTTDADNALNEIDVAHMEHSRFIGPYPAAIQESKEYRHDNSASEYHKRAWCGRQAVTGFKKALQLDFRECMRYIGTGFHLWNIRSHNICHLPISQVADEFRDDVYSRPATIICFCGALRASTVHYFLCQRLCSRERLYAIVFEKEQVVFICIVPPPRRFLKDNERFDQWGKKGLKSTHRRAPP
jgi:hypothetical protein